MKLPCEGGCARHRWQSDGVLQFHVLHYDSLLVFKISDVVCIYTAQFIYALYQQTVGVYNLTTNGQIISELCLLKCSFDGQIVRMRILHGYVRTRSVFRPRSLF